jgi:hypothetical protein
MSDIMELIVEYKNAFCDYVISGKRYAEARECYAILESSLSAMQEVCDAAVKCKGLGMNPDLFDAVTKYEAIKE